jgi:SAM-dependent methyltransferase
MSHDRDAAATAGAATDDAIPSVDELLAEARAVRPLHSRDQLLEYWWGPHPRLRFLKQAPRGAFLVDVGSGPGGLVFWREWLEPRRTDLRMFAVDRTKGEFFDRYAGHQTCDLEREDIAVPPGSADAIVLSHVLEHVRGEEAFLGRLARLLRPGGELYVEVPTPESARFPRRDEFLRRGVEVSTVNFFDDATHERTFTLDALCAAVVAAGLSVEESGRIRNRYVEGELMSHGVSRRDGELMTYGVWSRLGFAQYVRARRPAR